jgi:hypothetical protein
MRQTSRSKQHELSDKVRDAASAQAWGLAAGVLEANDNNKNSGGPGMSFSSYGMCGRASLSAPPAVFALPDN